ncbi:MAG: hypothetical protein L3K02_08735, partial [Thermoplasmata archaeon]|nr:hypothetical protein [Thermoplasmata archaeon]
LDFWVPLYTTFNFTIPAVGGYTPAPATGTESGLDQYSYRTIAITFSVSGTLYPVSFGESGLPPGTSWYVDAGGSTVYSTTTGIGFELPNETYAFTVSDVPGYVSTPSEGNVTVNGAAVDETITFSPIPPEYPVEIEESGLPGLTIWTATLAGSEQSSNATSIQFMEPNGSYPLSIGVPPGYLANPGAGTVNVSGSRTVFPVAFVQANTSYPISFVERGLAWGTIWAVGLGGSRVSSDTASLQFHEPNGTYPFTVAPVRGYSSNYTGTVAVDGDSVLVKVLFSNATFAVIFNEVGLPSGATWTVNAAEEVTGFQTVASSMDVNLTLPLLNGTYQLTVMDSLGLPGSLSVSALTIHGEATATVTVAFSPEACACGEQSASGNSIVPFVVLGIGALMAVTLALVVAFRIRKPPTGPLPRP